MTISLTLHIQVQVKQLDNGANDYTLQLTGKKCFNCVTLTSATSLIKKCGSNKTFLLLLKEQISNHNHLTIRLSYQKIS